MIEKHLSEFYLGKSKEIKVNDLVVPWRFDLGFKLGLINEFDSLNIPPEIDKRSTGYVGYDRHLQSITKGQLTELGKENKNGLDDYIDSFYHTYLSIYEQGFNNKISSIPVDSSLGLLNGAHRVSILLNHDQENSLPVELTNHPKLDYSYNYFKSTGVNSKLLDFSALNLATKINGFHIVCLWPGSHEKIRAVESIIADRIYYKKELSFSSKGKRNLMLHLYPNENWIGSCSTGFRGLDGKIFPCFGDKSNVVFYLIRENGLDKVLKLKEKIREEIGIGKHSVHITDTKEECSILARSIFNEASLSFLNNFSSYKVIGDHTCFIKSDNWIKNTNDIFNIDFYENSKISNDDFVYFLGVKLLSPKYLNSLGIAIENINYHELDVNKIDISDILFKVSKLKWRLLNLLRKCGVYDLARRFYRLTFKGLKKSQ